MPDNTEEKIEMVEIKRMVHELYDRLVIPEPVIQIVVPSFHILNIWIILKQRVMEIEDVRQERKNRNYV